jgi:hypothetical protein
MIRIPNDMATDRKVRLLATVTVALTILTTGYLVIAGLLGPGPATPGGGAPAASTLGQYAMVRNVVLIAAMAWPLLRRAWYPLSLVLWIGAAVQIGDTVVGAARHSAASTIGPACFAVLLVATARALGARYPARAGG